MTDSVEAKGALIHYLRIEGSVKTIQMIPKAKEVGCYVSDNRFVEVMQNYTKFPHLKRLYCDISEFA